ncbi:MAG TPA: hypothetical protein VFH68_05360 [Polyangia bacterium]|nr:hypothetical protein [Polyangia bacterium]
MRVVNNTFQATLNRKIDILFMIDNSQSMLPLQAKLLAQFPVFMDVLKKLPTGDGSGMGLPDVHVAVISSDTGPGRFDLPDRHCAYTGDGGHFQSAPRGSCTTPPLPADQHYLAASMNQGVKNYQGDISEAFTCIAALGDQGCGFEGQLKAVRWALDPLNVPDANVGFLRSDAFLAVILITNEDDCSVPDDSDMVDPQQTRMSDPLGPLWSWRCNEFGHLCNIGGQMVPPPRGPAMANLQGCISNETPSGKLTHVVDEINFLKSLKPDPNQIFVAAITGPTTPYSIQMIQNAMDVEQHPDIVHSCMQATGEYADPAVRIQQWVEAFGNHGLLQTICAPTFAPSLMLIATELSKLLGPQCISNKLVDLDVSTPEIDPQCQVTDQYVNDQQKTISSALPSCASNGNQAPCWSLQADPVKCPNGTLLLNANRGPGQLPNGLSTSVSCAMCIDGVAKAGCPCTDPPVAGCK